MLYSFKGSYPIEGLPDRIRLSNGLTRTISSTFTEDEIKDAGYTKVPDRPIYNSEYQKLEWDYDKWIIKDIPLEEKIQEVKKKQNYFIKILMFLVERYEREKFLNLKTTDDFIVLQNLAKKIFNIEQQEKYPFEIEWPVPQDFRSNDENNTWQTPV